MTWETLRETVALLNQRTGSDVDEARREPGKRVRLAEAVRLEVGPWSNDADRRAVDAAAKTIARRLADEYREDGRDARDERLVELADKVDQLRAALPSLAASAAVELSNYSRNLRREAEARLP